MVKIRDEIREQLEADPNLPERARQRLRGTEPAIEHLKIHPNGHIENLVGYGEQLTETEHAI